MARVVRAALFAAAIAVAPTALAGCLSRAPAPAAPTLVAATRPAPPRSLRSPEIRVVSAPRIREVSAAGIAPRRDLHDLPPPLPAPHRIRAGVPLPEIHGPFELRTLIGRRDPRDPLAAVLAWSRRLTGTPFTAATGPDLVERATRDQRLRAVTHAANPGDLLVFGRAVDGTAADLVAVVVARDDRGVIEFVYLGNGIVRRGFVDPARPRTKRDTHGRTVNTFIRHGRRFPPKGTRYLSGELLSHIISVR